MKNYPDFKDENDFVATVKKEQKRNKAKFATKVKTTRNFDDEWDDWDYPTFEKITKGKREKWQR